MCFSLARSFRQCFLKKLTRLFELSLVKSDHSQIVQRAFVMWIDLKSLAVKRSRIVSSILSKSQIAERKVRFDVRWDIGISDHELFFRQWQVVGFQRLPTG